MTTSEKINFEQRVKNYVGDNISYISEYVPAPNAQDILLHWQTNGAEGIGEELTQEQQELFLRYAAQAVTEALENA